MECEAFRATVLVELRIEDDSEFGYAEFGENLVRCTAVPRVGDELSLFCSWRDRPMDRNGLNYRFRVERVVWEESYEKPMSDDFSWFSAVVYIRELPGKGGD
jgi:hypothetical protein